MIFDTVYLGTCIRRRNITQFDSIRMLIMRNNRVLILVLHVAHDAKCCFALCVLVFFRQLSANLANNNFILSQKCQCLSCMSIKKKGRAVGSIKNGTSLRLIHNLS